jgi:hypothetical protein
MATFITPACVATPILTGGGSEPNRSLQSSPHMQRQANLKRVSPDTQGNVIGVNRVAMTLRPSAVSEPAARSPSQPQKSGAEQDEAGGFGGDCSND